MFQCAKSKPHVALKAGAQRGSFVSSIESPEPLDSPTIMWGLHTKHPTGACLGISPAQYYQRIGIHKVPFLQTGEKPPVIQG